MNDPHRTLQGRARHAFHPGGRVVADASSVEDRNMIGLVAAAAGAGRRADEAAPRVLYLDTHPTLDLTALARRNDGSRLGALIGEAPVTGIPREPLAQQGRSGSGVPRHVHLAVSPGREPAEEKRADGPEIVVHGWDVTDRPHPARRFPGRPRRDQLVGLRTRPELIDRLRQEIAWSVRAGHGLALIVVQVDGMSAVDGTYGHQTGDQALAMLCGRLACSLRPEDTFARVGTEEFAAICPDLVAPEDAMGVVDRLRLAATEPISTPLGELTLALTVGAAFVSDHDAHDRVALLLRRAGRAIKEAGLADQRKPRP